MRERALRCWISSWPACIRRWDLAHDYPRTARGRPPSSALRTGAAHHREPEKDGDRRGEPASAATTVPASAPRSGSLSRAKLLRNAVGRSWLFENRLVQVVEHHVGVFARVLIVLPHHLHGTEADDPKEELSLKITFTDKQGNAIATLGGELSDKLGDHLPAHPLAANLGVGREVKDVNPVSVQLVDHESDDPLAELSHHADTVPLAQDTEEFLLAPGELEAGVLDGQDFGHVAPDHPADVHPGLGLGGWDRAHRASF